MKKNLLLAFAVVLFTISNTSFAQDKEIIRVERTQQKKTPVVEAAVIDNVIMDSRALKHYSEHDIITMPTVKKMQVNYLYSESFIPSPDNQYTSACPNDFTGFDVAQYNDQREENKRVKVITGDCKLAVILLSWEEVRAHNEKIAGDIKEQK